jgi:hypothetical protein
MNNIINILATIPACTTGNRSGRKGITAQNNEAV